MQLRKLLVTICITAGALALTMPAFTETTDNLGQGQAIVTVMPLENNDTPVNIQQDDLRAEVNGKKPDIIGWTPFRGLNSGLELLILIDGSAHAGIGLQLEDIAGFIRDLPADVKVAVGYLEAGSAVLREPFSSDHNRAIDELRIPAGVVGSNASPYFCLSDLAKHWPSENRNVRREVIMITDGVDNYYPAYDSENPYLQAAIRDSIRAGLVIYSIYTPNRGQEDDSGHRSFMGQSLLTDVTNATGGYTYWDGSDRYPVSFRPYFDDIAQRLQNQYQLKFQSRLKGKPEIQRMSLKVVDRKVTVFAPQRVNVTSPGAE
jgi:hypothetical protein